MTQGDICRKLNMDRSYMSAIGGGKKNITLIKLKELASALDVSVDELEKFLCQLIWINLNFNHEGIYTRPKF